MRATLFLMLVWWAAAAGADLASVKAEPNAEKRSELALQVAGEALDASKAAWRQGDASTFQTKLEEVGAAAELCLSSLHDTGKPPYKLVKWYKKAELSTRELSRKLEGFAQEASLDERPAIQKVTERVQTVHEELLLGVLSRKK